MLTVKLIKSPSVKHKYRVIFPDKRAIDFGAKGYSDYTIHKNPVRMRAYVVRHGGIVSKRVRKEEDARTIHREMLRVDKSMKETWTVSGLYTAGFWSRWLLWSFPSLSQAKMFMASTFKLRFV